MLFSGGECAEELVGRTGQVALTSPHLNWSVLTKIYLQYHCETLIYSGQEDQPGHCDFSA